MFKEKIFKTIFFVKKKKNIFIFAVSGSLALKNDLALLKWVFVSM